MIDSSVFNLSPLKKREKLEAIALAIALPDTYVWMSDGWCALVDEAWGISFDPYFKNSDLVLVMSKLSIQFRWFDDGVEITSKHISSSRVVRYKNADDASDEIVFNILEIAVTIGYASH